MLSSKGFTLAQITESLTGMTLPLLLLNIIMDIVGYPLAIFFGCKLSKYKPHEFLSVKNLTASFVIKAVIVTLGFQVIGSILANFVTIAGTSLGYELTTLDVNMQSGLSYNFALIILTCIIAPIFEELLFRGIILRSLSKINVVFGIILSSFLFGLFHANIPQMIAAFFMGCALSFVAIKSGSIVPCMIMHFFANFNSVIQTLMMQKSETLAVVYSLIFNIIVIVLTVIIIILDKNNFRLKVIKTKGKKVMSPLMTSIPFWICIVAYLYEIFTSIKKV